MGYDPNEPRDGNGRWSRMNSTSRAKLTASARFKTKFSGPSKNSKGKAVGLAPARVKGDEKFFINPTGAKGGSFPVYKYEDSAHAVAIQTAKALDKDFHHAKSKADKDAMRLAISRTTVPVIKYPSKRPKK